MHSHICTLQKERGKVDKDGVTMGLTYCFDKDGVTMGLTYCFEYEQMNAFVKYFSLY